MAVQQARAGLKAIYLSGWQVAADANSTGQMYPDQSLYPVNSVPDVVKKLIKLLSELIKFNIWKNVKKLILLILTFFFL